MVRSVAQNGEVQLRKRKQTLTIICFPWVVLSFLGQLFGGSRKLLPSGNRLRGNDPGGSTTCSFSIHQVTLALHLQGDINVLLLGDPGTAKSQVHKKPLGPHCSYTWCNLWYSHLWIIDWSCLIYIYIYHMSYIFIKLLHCVKWCLNMPWAWVLPLASFWSLHTKWRPFQCAPVEASSQQWQFFVLKSNHGSF